MAQQFTAIVWREEKWFVAQCLQVDIASQGKSEVEALENLREALELHFESPMATITSRPHIVEIDLRAAA